MDFVHCYHEKQPLAKRCVKGDDFDDKSIDDVSDGNGSVSGGNHGPGRTDRS